MYRTITTIFRGFCFITWMMGIFMPDQRALLWAFPAGYAVGGIVADWIFSTMVHKTAISSSINAKDLTSEQRTKMEEAMRTIAEMSGAPLPDDFGKKCDDPHCEGCWGDNKEV